jgi:hypothetical protein
MTEKLPAKFYVLSLIVGVSTAVASILGLLFPATFYPTEALRQAFLANDVVNFIIGLPILFGSMWLARRGRLVGLLLWPGALLYGLYNYTAYVVGLPFRLSTLFFLAIVLLYGYVTFELVKSIDKKVVQTRLAGNVPVKTSGWVLVVFGASFLFRTINMIAEANMNQTVLPGWEIGVLTADSILSIFLITGGILLLLRRPLGFVSGLGLLFAASMLFVGLIAILLLRPVFTDLPLVFVDVLVVAVMGLICFVPFGLFLRGVG